MLRLITENKFKKSICNLGKPNIIREITNKDILPLDWPYYQVEGGFVIWVKLFRVAIIYGDYKGDINLEVPDFSNWALTKVSDTPSKKYILNKMKEHVYLSSDFYELCGKGDWILEEDGGEKFEFTIKTSGNYFITTAIGYPEKNKDIIRLADIIKKDRLIESITYGIRKVNPRSDFES